MLGNLTLDEMKDLLTQNTLGRIGCNDGERTYIVPVSYVFNGQYILAHSVEGMKIRMMRKNPSICFQVEEIKSPTNWKSVILWGVFQELTDEMERYHGMKIFVERMMKLKISTTAQPPEISEQRVRPHQPGSVKPVIYRILVEEMSGRFERD
jgi:nitroimidazol reductase NimA-like FMN-containing flavoprotein (pyridoxamine 5'-phosphate oxidase superfamily)